MRRQASHVVLVERAGVGELLHQVGRDEAAGGGIPESAHDSCLLADHRQPQGVRPRGSPGGSAAASARRTRTHSELRRVASPERGPSARPAAARRRPTRSTPSTSSSTGSGSGPIVGQHAPRATSADPTGRSPPSPGRAAPRPPPGRRAPRRSAATAPARTTCSSSDGSAPRPARTGRRRAPAAAVTSKSWLPRRPGDARARGPGCSPFWNASAAALASLSAASLSSWPLCPFTHSKRTRSAPSMAASSAFMISTLATGLPSPFFQPRRFQPGIHLGSS